MPEEREPGFTYRACGPYTKNNKRIQKFKGTGACFQHDRTCGAFKNLTERKASDKTLVIKHLMLLKIQNIMNIKGVLLQRLINLSIKRLQVQQLKMKLFLIKNYLKNYTNQLLLKK